MRSIVFAGLLAALPAAPAAAQQLPASVIAVVDMQRLARDCTACRAGAALLDAQEKQLRDRVRQSQASLEPERRAVDQAMRAAQGNPDAALRQRAASLQAQRIAADQQLGVERTALRRNQAFVRDQISARLRPIVDRLMRDRGANIVVSKGATFALSPALEITDAVLAEINREMTTVNAVAPAPVAPTAPAPR